MAATTSVRHLCPTPPMFLQWVRTHSWCYMDPPAQKENGIHHGSSGRLDVTRNIQSVRRRPFLIRNARNWAVEFMTNQTFPKEEAESDDIGRTPDRGAGRISSRRRRSKAMQACSMFPALKFELAHHLMICCAHARWPFAIATESGVLPFVSACSWLAPASSSTRTHSADPCSHAPSSGVRPRLHASTGFAPHMSSASTQFTWPLYAATASGVQPSEFL
mmetsp:Transcript_24968/g.53945  ORF Transcript_24968/g.53945 Transcript_24968/m.53945 type:complete len:219 (-) Transcript_24968:147-803(-)